MKPIRVGLIRCDTHGMYYGALMEKHDPMLLRDPMQGRDRKARDSWQRGGIHLYFYLNYADSMQMTAPSVGGFRIARVWDDQDRGSAEMLSEVCHGQPRVCDTLEEVSEDVDLVFIADCNGEGKDHYQLAAPGLKKGVPTFIDKPFAYDVEDARRILQLAKKHAAPVMSLSMLRASPQASAFARRLEEIAPVEFGTVRGFTGGLAGQIHGISLAQAVFGAGVEGVRCMGQTELAHVLLDYGAKPRKPRAGVMLNNESGNGWHGSIHASAFSARGAIHAPGIGDFQHPDGAARILGLVKRMVRTGKPQADHGEMLEAIAIAQAARLAQKTGKRVALDEVLE